MKKVEAKKSFLETTKHYYSLFLGSSSNLFAQHHPEPFFLYTPVRNTPLQGYESCFHLLAMQTEQGIVISYGDAVRNRIPELKKRLGSKTISLCEALYQTFQKEPQRSFKYYFSGDMPEAVAARPLTASDYEAFEAFFLGMYPDSEDISWLREYFREMVLEGLCIGVFADNLLVSCTDSPAVPFMKDSVREIGINTLEAYRKQGYAKDACSRAVQEIVKQGKCPIWSTGSDNLPSQRLAEAVGFSMFGESFSVT